MSLEMAEFRLVTVSQRHIMPIQELLNLLHRRENSGMIGL